MFGYRQVQLLGRHARQLIDQHLGQLAVGGCCRFLRGQVGQIGHQLAHQRRDGQRAALSWQARRVRRHEQEAHAAVLRDAVAVRHAARNPDAALRRHHPQALRHRAGHAALQGQHQLAHGMPVRRRFLVVLVRVHTHGIGPLRVHVGIEERGGVVQAVHWMCFG
ncbi:hypothetical protein [Achromobacter sp.]|uniref:hypothetical protein n=1 Tax=Achromobacter sp. TaxID=134375 RepID=UPI003C791FD3